MRQMQEIKSRCVWAFGPICSAQLIRERAELRLWVHFRLELEITLVEGNLSCA